MRSSIESSRWTPATGCYLSESAQTDCGFRVPYPNPVRIDSPERLRACPITVGDLQDSIGLRLLELLAGLNGVEGPGFP